MFGKRKKEDISIQNFNERIELTLVDPRAISRDVHTLVNVAVKNGYLGVCVNPINVAEARSYIDEKVRVEMRVIAVIGFPLGATSISAKVQEAKEAISAGADELDVVINIGAVKSGDFAFVKSELSRIVRIAKGRIVKAIIETCYLSREEIKDVVKACVKAKVDFVQTSTGYGTGGATAEDILLIKEVAGGKIEVKAAGGVRSRAQAEELVRAGAIRIGTSKVI